MTDILEVKFNFDPLGAYANVSPYTLQDLAGFLPGWAANPDYMDKPIREAMDIQYDFGLHQFDPDKSSVDERGVYRYPGDPDMSPVLKITRGDEVMYVYEYGIVAFVNDAETFVTRMD